MYDVSHTREAFTIGGSHLALEFRNGGFAHTMSYEIDRYSHIASPLQRWDARFKIAGLFTLIFCISLIHSVLAAILALATAWTLLAFSALPREFVRSGTRFAILLLLPMLVILPLSYPEVDARGTHDVLFSLSGFRVAITIVVKAVAMVLISYTIFGTSRFDVSMVALQHLRCPSVIVQMLLFSYRYVFVFLSELQRMDIAMRARGFIARSNTATLRTYGHFIGSLLVRSFERTERIFKAMLSKGYTGKFHSLIDFKATRIDYYKAIAAAAVGILLLLLDAAWPPAARGWI